MGVSERYNQWSATYDNDSNRTRDLDAAVVRVQLRGKRYRSVAEIGCGTGKNTELLAALAESVTAFDFSEGMLALARSKLSGSGVTFTRADITQGWPCADACHDLVMCNLVLEHVEALGFVFREAHRVLEPGGTFFVSELHPSRQYRGSVARFNHGGEEVRVDAFVHHVSEFTASGLGVGFELVELKESWHEEDDAQGPPRLLTLIWRKRGA